MADRLSQEVVEALLAGVGAGRLSQEAVEALLAGQGNAVLSQEAVEVLIAHTGITSVALSQLAVEVLVANPGGPVGLKTILGIPKALVKVQTVPMGFIKTLDGLA